LALGTTLVYFTGIQPLWDMLVASSGSLTFFIGDHGEGDGAATAPVVK